MPVFIMGVGFLMLGIPDGDFSLLVFGAVLILFGVLWERVK